MADDSTPDMSFAWDLPAEVRELFDNPAEEWDALPIKQQRDWAVYKLAEQRAANFRQLVLSAEASNATLAALTEARAELTALRQDAEDNAVLLAKVTTERDTIVDAAARLLRSIQEATPRVDRSVHSWSWDGSWILTKAGERHGLALIAAIDAIRRAPPDEWTTMDAITGPVPTGTPDTTEKT